MRILFVTEEPIRFSGTMVRGGQIHVRNVVEGLRDRGHDVHLVDWNSDPDRPFQHSIDPRSRFIDGAARTFQQIVRVGRRFVPEVVVSKTRKVYVPALVAARVLGIPHVVHVGSSPASSSDGFIDRLDAFSFGARLRAPHDAYFVVCGAIGDDLRSWQINPNKIFDVQNAVDTTRFVPNPEINLSNSIREKISNANRPLLGFIGGITEYKGIFDLAAAIEQTETNPTVAVVGSGPAREQFEIALGDRGLFLGSVDYKRMPAVYAAIDALVLPSHTEGLPRVILEAGAAEKPVIATAVGAIPEVVSEGQTGLLCPPQNPSKLATMIDRLLTGCSLTTLGRQAREVIVNEYTWSEQYDRYEMFLNKIVTNRHSIDRDRTNNMIE